MTRVCSKCGTEKEHSEFYAQANCRDGIRPSCKTCDRAKSLESKTKRFTEDPKAFRAANRDWVERNRDRANAASRKYYANNREKKAAIVKAGRERHPQKAAAQVAARAAIAAGTLVPEPCLFCDEPNVEAHHYDYSRPLEVTFLCRRHHRLIHRTADLADSGTR